MDRDAQTFDDEPRELRLEGLGLAIVGGIILALLFGAFQLGRTVERWSAPGRASSSSSDASANAEQDAVDSTEKLTRARLRSTTRIWFTWPIRTPAMSTSEPTVRPVTSVNRAL